MVNLKWWWVGSGRVAGVAQFGQRLWREREREREREKNEGKKKVTVLQTVWE